MKGFKDSNKKFHPITNKKGVRKSRDQNAKNQGVRMKRSDGSRIKKIQYKVWKFEDAPKDLQEKILEKNREINLGYDNFWAEYDGLIYDKKTKIADHDVFSHYWKKYYDLDRGQYIQFPDLEIKDEKKLYKMLGLPKSLEDKIQISFNSTRLQHSNTEIDFIENESGSTLAVNDPDLTYEEYKKSKEEYKEKPLTKIEFTSLQKANKKWDDLMDDAWRSLRDSYDYQWSDEAVKETLISNEYEFNEEGNIA